MSRFMAPLLGGSLEIVCGPMFSGKSEELVRRIRRAQIARQKVQVFKPAIDDRFHKTDVVSRTSLSFKAHPVEKATEILEQLKDSTRIVGIDEVQFFDDSIIEVAGRLVGRGIRIVCSGLDQYSNGEPFGPMPELLAIADQVDKVQAICTVCGAPATKTHRMVPTDDVKATVVADNDIFQARCRAHHFSGKDDGNSLAFASLTEEGL